MFGEKRNNYIGNSVGKISNTEDVEFISTLLNGSPNDFFKENPNCLSKKINKKLLREECVNSSNSRVNKNNKTPMGTKVSYTLSNYFQQFESIGEIFIEDMENIKIISLEIGGSEVDRIPNCDVDILKALQGIYNIKGIPFSIFKKGIPYVRYHEIRVNVEFKDEVDLDRTHIFMKIYENKDDIGNIHYADAVGYNPRFVNYHVAGITDSNVTNTMKLYFNHVTTALLIKTSDGSKPDFISFKSYVERTGFIDNKLYLNKYSTKFGYDIYKFKPHKIASAFTSQSSIDNTLKCGINMSRADDVQLHFPNNNLKTVTIFQIYMNGTAFMSGMGGLLYSA